MRQFFKMFFASFLAMVVMGVVVLAVIIGIIAGASRSAKSDKTDVAENSVLLIETDKLVHELGETNSIPFFFDEDDYTPGLYDVTRAIEHAKTDKNIKGIFIKLSYSANGWATLQQMREALKSFKAGGDKFIYAYGEMIPQKTHYLASVADSVFLNPVGFTEFKGLSSEIPFFKGTFQKLEIEPEIFYAGKFKSATEPFRADKMSEPNREQIAALQNSFWSQFLSAVAEHSKSDTASLHQLAMTGAIQFPGDALRYRLVDGLLYADQVEQRIRNKTGKKEKDKINFIKLDKYAGQLRRDKKIKSERIAVLMAEGAIMDGERSDAYEIASKDFTEEIRKVKKDDKIKAVVLRVNSPGGSALASEVILRELQLLRQKKPLIVSMGDVAASGGYYIACQADSIFALPNTITGSIGVFTMLFNTQNLFKNKLGISFDQVKNAPYADFPSVTRPMNEQEKQKMQSYVDTIYQTFKGRVAVGRNMDVMLVDSFAQGRVWSGTDALRIGLIDGLGDLSRAIESAAAKAGLKDYQVVTYPAPVDKFQMLMKQFKGSSVSAEMLKAAAEQEMSSEFQLYKEIKSLQRMNGKVQMVMPFHLKID